MGAGMRKGFWVGLAAVALALTGWSAVAEEGGATPASRLFVNEDCWHFWMADSREGYTPLKPGIGSTRQGLEGYIDEIARGKVTHFLMNVNGQRANFPSRVFEPVWTSLDEPDRRHEKWVMTLKRLADEGIDPYRVWIGRCRQKGVSPWISVRMNDLHRTGQKDCPNISTLWRQRPELQVRPGNEWDNGFDYSKKEVRKRMLGFVREVLDRYDADGLELDLLRFPRYLPIGREAELAHVLTYFIGEVRAEVDAAAKRRGHRIVLSVRVPATPQKCRDAGLAVDGWAKGKLVDMIVPCNMWANIRFDLPLAEWREWTASAADIVPGADSGITEKGVRREATLTEYRRWAGEMRKRGARELYLYNLFLHPQDGEVWNGVLSDGL